MPNEPQLSTSDRPVVVVITEKELVRTIAAITVLLEQLRTLSWEDQYHLEKVKKKLFNAYAGTE